MPQGRGSQRRLKRPKVKGQTRDREVTTRDVPATTAVRGSAQGDALVALPLLGHKYEIKQMLYYDSRFELTGAGGILQVHYFRANDVFDPDATGVGHQPVGFDQAMLFWEQFAVFSSKITVNFRSNTADGIRVGVFLSPDQTNPSIQELMENGYVTSDVVVGTNSIGLGYHTFKRVDMTCSNVKYFQMRSKEEYFANPNFIGTAASSPTELVYFGVFAFNHVTTSTTDVLYDVELSYDVRFQEPRKVLPSLLMKNILETKSVSGVQPSKPIVVSRADVSNNWRQSAQSTDLPVKEITERSVDEDPLSKSQGRTMRPSRQR